MCPLLDMTRLLLSLRWPPEEDFRYCNSTQKKTIGQFSLHFYSLFPFDLPLTISQLSIIRSGFLVPGPTGLHHVVHWGGVKNIRILIWSLEVPFFWSQRWSLLAKAEFSVSF